MAKAKTSTLNMTEGTIWKQLVIFSLPLLLGNLFQQLYSTVDSWVVGNFVGPNAFGAVTSNTPAINALIGMFMGFSSGSSVVISQFFGANDIKDLRKSTHTAVVTTFLIGIIMSAVGFLGAGWIVSAMQSAPEIAPEARTYLRIYFTGLVWLMLYNMGCAILRAVGDSKKPLYFLIFSSVVNTALDLLLVIKFNMGVAGVAWATVISEFLATVLTFAILFRSRDVYGLSFKELRIDSDMLKRIIRIGLPSGFQVSLTSFSNIFVQGYINSFGAVATAGWGSYNRIDSFAILPVQSLSIATTTFAGQNAGARRFDRIRKSEKVSLGICVGITLALSAAIWAYAPALVRFFNKDAAVVEMGTYILRWITPFNVVFCFYMIQAGILRGVGEAKGPMVIMLSSFVAFRQLYLFLAMRITGEFLPVILGYPLGWAVCAVSMAVFFYRYVRRNWPA